MICAAAPGRADEFFPVRDENPLIRGFYLPLPSDTAVEAPFRLDAALSIMNTLNVEARGSESLHVDGESDTLRLSVGDGFASSWRYRITVPIIHDSGGFLDAVIDDWHEAFDLSRGNRPYYPKYQLDYSYSGLGNVHLNGSQTSLGDIAAELGWYGIADGRRTVSLWLGLAAPTGSVAKLTGNGAWDSAGWMHAALRVGQWQLAGELGFAQPFGDEIFAGHAHKITEFSRAAVTRALGSRWSLRVQLDAQTGRVEDSQLRLLGPSLQLELGIERRLRGRWRISCGFAEDAAVDTAPDITFFLGIHD
jgi:hypothetical protein